MRGPGYQGRWLRRAVRGAAPDRNPLRRATDRLETCLLAGLFAAAAAGTPFAALAASHASYAHALQLRQEQLATRYRVRAVLTAATAAFPGYAMTTDVPAQAAWASVGGTPRSGTIPAPPGSPRGTAVPVWTDGRGYLVSPPLTAAAAAGEADAAMAGTIAALAAVCWAGTAATRRGLNRRRMAAWAADWLVTAPAWNRQSW